MSGFGGQSADKAAGTFCTGPGTLTIWVTVFVTTVGGVLEQLVSAIARITSTPIASNQVSRGTFTVRPPSQKLRQLGTR